MSETPTIDVADLIARIDQHLKDAAKTAWRDAPDQRLLREARVALVAMLDEMTTLRTERSALLRATKYPVESIFPRVDKAVARIEVWQQVEAQLRAAEARVQAPRCDMCAKRWPVEVTCARCSYDITRLATDEALARLVAKWRGTAESARELGEKAEASTIDELLDEIDTIKALRTGEGGGEGR